MSQKRPELLIPASSLEVLKTADYVWCRCSIYWWRSIWASCESKEFFHGRYEEGCGICACTWCKSTCDGQYSCCIMMIFRE